MYIVLLFVCIFSQKGMIFTKTIKFFNKWHLDRLEKAKKGHLLSYCSHVKGKDNLMIKTKLNNFGLFLTFSSFRFFIKSTMIKYYTLKL